MSIFQEFKENSKINKAGFNYNRKDDEFLVYVHCPQMDINIKNEQNRLLNLCYKHGLCWGSSWEMPQLTQILAIKPTYSSNYVFKFKKKKTDSSFSMY